MTQPRVSPQYARIQRSEYESISREKDCRFSNSEASVGSPDKHVRNVLL